MVALIADYVFPEILRTAQSVPAPRIQTDISTSVGGSAVSNAEWGTLWSPKSGYWLRKSLEGHASHKSDTSFETGLLRTLTLCFKSLCHVCTVHNEPNLLL